MRIYIHTDLEGVMGLGDGSLISDRDSDSCRQACGWLIDEVNAAARGFFAAGATEVMALDSHGGGGNLTEEGLDDRVKLEDNSKQIWWGSLDETWDATCFIGAHALSGTPKAFLEHTQSSRDWYRYFVDGRETGELGQWAACAGEFGVPMIFATGDEAACAEARDFFDPVVTVATKTASGRMKAECLPVEEAAAKVEEGAKRSVELIGRAKPFVIPKPATIRWEFCRCAPADNAEGLEGVTRVGAREVEKVVTSAHYAVVPGLLRSQEPPAEKKGS